jgi:hypothetical protein
LGAFLEHILGLHLKEKDEWEQEIVTLSPIGPYIVSGGSSKSLNVKSSIIIDTPDTRTSDRRSLHVSWDIVLEEIGQILAIVCAAGGSKALIDLLRAWVEERSGRKIRIKRGDVELEIQGRMSEKRIQEIINTFEKEFGESRILTP